LLDAIPVATLPINVDLGLAPKYTGYIPWWLGSFRVKQKRKKRHGINCQPILPCAA